MGTYIFNTDGSISVTKDNGEIVKVDPVEFGGLKEFEKYAKENNITPSDIQIKQDIKSKETMKKEKEEVKPITPVKKEIKSQEAEPVRFKNIVKEKTQLEKVGNSIKEGINKKLKEKKEKEEHPWEEEINSIKRKNKKQKDSLDY